MTRHQYGISVLIFQMPFGKETSDSVVKCQLFSQASHLATFHKLLSPFLSYWQNRSRDKVFQGADSKDLNPIFGYSVKKYKICVQVKESGIYVFTRNSSLITALLVLWSVFSSYRKRLSMIWRIVQFEEGVLLALAGDTLQELHNFQIIRKPHRPSVQLTSLVLILQA